ncbi:MAG TPA: tetratricopeptide repeat protein [Lacunisphaera sp.]|jgi:tetratricopeptide (TPR) repeat protein
MSILRKIFLLSLLLPLCGMALDDADLNQFNIDQQLHQKSGPKLDPKRIINQSNSFLKEREPEMTEEEYALYEKIVNIMGSNADLAVRLLEGMMSEKQHPSPAFEFILGNAYYNAGKIDQAEKRYRSAVERYPTFIRAWNNLGVLYYTGNRFAEAATCFSKSITLGDHDPTTFGLLGYSLERGEDYISAEMAFMQALGGDPGNADWKEGLLRICISEKQNIRAEALVKTLIKDHPQESRYWLMYANILVSENRKLEAIVLLESAVGTGVAGPDELTLLGDLYAAQRLFPEAIAIYQKLPAPASLAGEKKLLAFAQMLTGSGKIPEAKRVLDSFKQELTPEGQIALHQAKADWFFAQNSMPEARKEIDSLLLLAPFNGRALLTRGRIYAVENDPSRATLAFEAAYRVDDTRYVASLELANIELKNRHYAKSVEYLQKALVIEKTPAIEDYLARIKTLVVTDDHLLP